ncbi:hypothetical protein [Romboutsia ilealis]|uniref:YfjL-like protein n=2 Tax=Romboutsia ilealis TaxID=1115758 RepID=UPI0025B786F2|nr:hypothetical protein [Romboutsia ilealis]
MNRYIKLFGVVLMLFISIFIYNSLNGNPIGYIKAKNNISEYIENHYNNKLKITNIYYSEKAGGYIGEVEEIDNPNNKSNINYYNTGYIGDDYHFRTYLNMSDEINSTLKNLIYQQTNISKDNITMDVYFELPKFKYKLNDDYSGKEPLTIELELKSNNGIFKKQEEFEIEARQILEVLKSVKYDYKSIIIYSYREDGNSRYEMDINNNVNINTIKKEEEISK